MAKFLDLNYYFIDTKNVEHILTKHNANLGYLEYLPKNLEVSIFNRTRVNKQFLLNRIDYIFYKKKAFNLFDILFGYHKLVKKHNPDYILIHGLHYGLYSFFLKNILQKKTIIMVQIHGYAPAPKGLKKILYGWANKYIDGYFFTGKNNARDWVNNKIFEYNKVFEIMEGSTNFKYNPKKTKTNQSFIWVGRLDKNKDPLTILKAFKKFLNYSPNAKLTMIYNTYELLNEVKVMLNAIKELQEAVTLLGKTDHDKLEVLYNNHQYFILGSHYEGSGYALAEAMMCRCIPIITKIPSYSYMTNNGECALLFTPGNNKELFAALKMTLTLDVEIMELKIAQLFDERLSFRAIANNIYETFEGLSKKKNHK